MVQSPERTMPTLILIGNGSLQIHRQVSTELGFGLGFGVEAYRFYLLVASGKDFSMPISPCPTVRHAHVFDGMTNPHVPEIWNKSITGPRPSCMKKIEESGLVDFQDSDSISLIY